MITMMQQKSGACSDHFDDALLVVDALDVATVATLPRHPRLELLVGTRQERQKLLGSLQRCNTNACLKLWTILHLLCGSLGVLATAH